MSTLAQNGSVPVAAGLDTLAVTGLALPFTPTGVTVALQKPGSNSDNISATVYGVLTADGFSVEFGSTVPTAGYVLHYEIWCETGEADTLNSMAVSYSELVRIVARFLGFTSALTSGQLEIVDAVIQSGVRQFYFPPAVNGVESAYEWSFMRPLGQLPTVASTRTYDLPNAFGRISGDFFFDSDFFFNNDG